MRIQGLQKLTLLDYPGRTACTVFLSGCNFRCPFCHNAPLLQGDTGDAMDEDALLMFLKKRQGVLDGVAVTGGEPLLRQELPSLLEKIKALGYAVKLDTNGAFPERLTAEECRAEFQSVLLPYLRRIRAVRRHTRARSATRKPLAFPNWISRPYSKAFRSCCAARSRMSFGQRRSRSSTMMHRFKSWGTGSQVRSAILSSALNRGKRS